MTRDASPEQSAHLVTLVPRAFTWHARTVLRSLRAFDHDFERRLRRAGLDGESSTALAIEVVKKEMERLKRQAAKGGDRPVAPEGWDKR